MPLRYRAAARYPAQMLPRIELERLDGPALAQERWRIAHPFRIGRAEGNELELPETSISRRHVSIEGDPHGWVLRDCGSLLGTLLNELPVESGAAVALRPGDTVGVGAWRFRVNALGDESGDRDTADTPTHISVVRGIGNLAEQRLELLLRYAGEVATASDDQALAEIVAEHALLGSGYARAAVLWRDGDEIVVRCRRPAPMPDAPAWRFHSSLVRSAWNGEIARLDVDAAGPRQAVRQYSARCVRR